MPTSPAEPGATASDARMAELDRRMAELAERLARTSGPSVEAGLIAQQNERIVELQRLVGQLGDRVVAMQAPSADRDAAGPGKPVGKGDCCGDAAGSAGCECHQGPCGCLSCDCCAFEVWMTHVRVDHMQPIEPDDTNLAPIDELEIWMFASIDPLHNHGVCIPDPGPSSYLSLHKQLTDPYGPWVSVNRCIGEATVPKGASRVVPLTLTAVEREPNRLIPGDRDEWGSASETLTLDCCRSTYPPITVPVHLNAWGQGGGAITAKFMVVRKC
jgi:hypothetical protein